MHLKFKLCDCCFDASILKCLHAKLFILFSLKKIADVCETSRRRRRRRCGFSKFHAFMILSSTTECDEIESRLTQNSRKAITKEEEEEDSHKRKRMMKFTIQFLFEFLNLRCFCCLFKAILHNVNGRNHTHTYSRARARWARRMKEWFKLQVGWAIVCVRACVLLLPK